MKKDKPPKTMAPHGLFLEDLEVGMSESFQKTVTDADIILFGGISGDTNPVHFSDEFAEDTMFGKRIAHGILTASFISTVLGTKLPGPGCVYLSQTLKFLAPVMIGDTVVARATIDMINQEKRRIHMNTACFVGEKKVVDGEALLWVPHRD